jgi:hypothetical protein
MNNAVTVTVHGVLAAAYPGKSRAKLDGPLLTHASADGGDTAMCGRVKPGHLCDVVEAGEPTCKHCARKLETIRASVVVAAAGKSTPAAGGRTAHNRFERDKGVFACETCGRKTRGSTGSNVRACSECYEVGGMENECQDGHTEWSDAKVRALPMLEECVRKGGNEDRLRGVFAWAYEAAAPAAPAPVKRGRGRPRNDASAAADRVVGVRLTAEAYERLAAAAAAANTTMSELLRGAWEREQG